MFRASTALAVGGWGDARSQVIAVLHQGIPLFSSGGRIELGKGRPRGYRTDFQPLCLVDG